MAAPITYARRRVTTHRRRSTTGRHLCTTGLRRGITGHHLHRRQAGVAHAALALAGARQEAQAGMAGRHPRVARGGTVVRRRPAGAEFPGWRLRAAVD